MASETKFPRRLYTGSCHCGNIKYITYLALPDPDSKITNKQVKEGSGLRIYKCNCNVCQKMGIFHMRLKEPTEDFFILSPGDLEASGNGMTSFVTPGRKTDWCFCTGCGVHCFSIRGPVEKTETAVPVEVAKKLGRHEEVGHAAGVDPTGAWANVSAWKLKDGFAESSKGGSNYFSLNVVSLDAGQEGVNFKKWHENGWIEYVDSLHDIGDWRVGEPHEGGIY